ncbi:hypothetical protein [Hyalangium rubrum]|uniref:Lipoprotein n=1 Tax=Hyalangium rubrum TaxID=3103134 RepID=A0ABU5H4R1_9BACT|nr:hypothetical protein [Hyalangium sp. s54d21]MDY7228467.1 hypothetical protein [Hyalangium sp. s54d21]
MKRLMLIAALAASASACVEGNRPVQLLEARPLDPTSDCEPGGPVLNGRLNFDISQQYRMAFTLASPLGDTSGASLDFYGEEIILSYEARNPSVSLKEERRPIYLVVQGADDDSTVEVNLIGDEARPRLETSVPSSPEAMTLLVSMKIAGKLSSGASVETNEVKFPIVISREGNPCAAGEVPTLGEGNAACFNPGQDGQAFTCQTP